MGVIIGPTPWWQNNLIKACPVGTVLPDGSIMICKSGGTAWIVAPFCTQVTGPWNNSTITVVGNKPCVCDWPTLNARLLQCGFNPSDWFVPNTSQMINPFCTCKIYLDCLPTNYYWVSDEINCNTACAILMPEGSSRDPQNKATNYPTRALRCVTY
jgi:hypothetical protein